MDQPVVYIYGKNPVQEALRSDHPVREIIIARELQQKDAGHIRRLAENKNIQIKVVPKAHLQKYCGPVVHQGVVAAMNAYAYITESDLLARVAGAEHPLILFLDQIQDTHNLGAIIRTAALSGVTAVVIPEKVSAEINPTVAKTSAGAVFHVPIHQTQRLFELIDILKSKGLKFAALMPGRENNIYQSDLRIPLALVVGSEGKGVRKNILNQCDLRLTIPQMGKLDSLNASVSTAIILFEIMRQRHFA